MTVHSECEGAICLTVDCELGAHLNDNKNTDLYDGAILDDCPHQSLCIILILFLLEDSCMLQHGEGRTCVSHVNTF